VSIVGGVDVSDESTTMGRGRGNVIASVLVEGRQILLIVGGVVGFCKSKYEWLEVGESGDSVQTVVDGQRCKQHKLLWAACGSPVGPPTGLEFLSICTTVPTPAHCSLERL